jgi:hypothetical protein
MEAWLPSIPDTGRRTEYWTPLMETAPSVCRDVFLDDPMGDPWESWTYSAGWGRFQITRWKQIKS